MLLDLGRGWPSSSLLPSLDTLLSSAQEELTNSDQEEALQYGADAGSETMRQAIAHDLRNDAINSNQVMVTNGCSQGLSMCCSRFSRPGDAVLVESITYFYVQSIFQQHGLEILRVPPAKNSNVNNDNETTGGTLMDLDSLETILSEMQEKNETLPTLLYTVALSHNPTGATIDEDKARRLIQLARRFGFKIISDEVYLFLTFNCDRPPRSLFEHDDDKNDSVVLALNSFSKILAPGLRLGWLESSTNNIKVLEETGFIVSGGGTNPFTSTIVSKVIRNGKQRQQIDLLCRAYKRRSKILTDSLERELGAVPSTVETILSPVVSEPCFVQVTGGFFLWLRFPTQWNIDTTDLLDFCKKRKEPVSFFPGALFSLGTSLETVSENDDDLSCKSAVRLCFAYLDEPDISRAVSELAKAVDEFKRK